MDNAEFNKLLDRPTHKDKTDWDKILKISQGLNEMRWEEYRALMVKFTTNVTKLRNKVKEWGDAEKLRVVYEGKVGANYEGRKRWVILLIGGDRNG